MREGDTLSLYCHTEGIPKPKVSWFFRKRNGAAGTSGSVHNHHVHSHHHHSSAAVAASSHHIAQHSKTLHEQVFQEGDTLVIKNVSRFYSGVFECIANNSVPPAASRKIKVSIECKYIRILISIKNVKLIKSKMFSFLVPPELHVHQERVEQMIGQDARFECRIRANPLTNHYWMKDGRVIESVGGGGPNDHVTSGLIMVNNNHGGDASQKSSGKYEIVTYNQNSHENLIISALVVKVSLTKFDPRHLKVRFNFFFSFVSV